MTSLETRETFEVIQHAFRAEVLVPRCSLLNSMAERDTWKSTNKEIGSSTLEHEAVDRITSGLNHVTNISWKSPLVGELDGMVGRKPCSTWKVNQGSKSPWTHSSNHASDDGSNATCHHSVTFHEF